MLAAKKLPEILRSVLTDGVEGAVILTVEGSVLASDFLVTPANVNETSLAAIGSSIWYNYAQGNNELIYHVIKLKDGSVAIAPIGKGYLLVAFGSHVSLGLLKGRVEALSQYFHKIFELMK